MEKLSGILPTNNRISNVDLANGPAIRPGAPSFGRPMGINADIRQQRLDAFKAAEAAKADENKSPLRVSDKLEISPEAMVKAKLADSPVPEKVSAKPGEGIKAVDVVEQQISSKIKLETDTESEMSAYPQATRDILNKTSIVNQLVNEMPEATGALINREEEEI